MTYVTTITHNTTVGTAYGPFAVGQSIGSIYLGDIGRRNSLGGGASVYGLGQDQYIEPGQTIHVTTTSDVLLSETKGILFRFMAMGVLTVSNA